MIQGSQKNFNSKAFLCKSSSSHPPKNAFNQFKLSSSYPLYIHSRAIIFLALHACRFFQAHKHVHLLQSTLYIPHILYILLYSVTSRPLGEPTTFVLLPYAVSKEAQGVGCLKMKVDYYLFQLKTMFLVGYMNWSTNSTETESFTNIGVHQHLYIQEPISNQARVDGYT